MYKYQDQYAYHLDFGIMKMWHPIEIEMNTHQLDEIKKKKIKRERINININFM